MSRYDSDDDYDFGGGGDTFSSGTTQASSRPSGGTTSVHTPVLTRPGYDSPIDDQQHEDGTVDTGEASFLGSAQDDVSIPATRAHPLGFVVKDCGGAHIDSVWKERIPHSDFSCQTKAINAMDQATSTFMRSSKLTQTENDEAQQLELESACTGLEGWVPKSQDLYDFVLSKGALMDEQLKKVGSSRAFDDFNVLGLSDGEVVCHEVLSADIMKNVPVQRFDRDDRKQDDAVDQSVTSISWNSTGSIIVAGYGQQSHDGWCCGAKAGCAVWNIFSRDFTPEKPKHFLETSSCVMSVACHPELPAVVAAGTFNGEVYVWDTSIEDERPMQVAATRIDDYFHREAVVSVKWVYDEREAAHYLLVTESGEGKVLFWSLKNNLQAPLRGYLLQTKRKTARGRSEKAVVGGTTMSFQSGGTVTVGTDKDGNPIEQKVKYSTSFVVGSEGGQVFRCFLRQSRGARGELGPKWTPEAEDLLSKVSSEFRRDIQRHVESYVQDLGGSQTVSLESVYASRPPPTQLFPSPIDMTYEGHTGPVHDLVCSPFHRNIFLSCGADGTAGVYSVLQKQPLATFEPSSSYLMSASWSSVRPMVFALSSEDGGVYVYDISRSLSSPIFALPSSAKKGAVVQSLSVSNKNMRNEEAPCTTTIAFNPRVGSLVASGDASGSVRIWKLSPAFSTSLVNEDLQLEKFFEDFEDEEEKQANLAKKKQRAHQKSAVAASGKAGQDSQKK
jgi:WD repeat-containing protein 34